MDPRVQRASSSVLRTLAFKDEAAKRAIIDCGAIEPLIRMLRSEVLSAGTHLAYICCDVCRRHVVLPMSPA